MLGAPSEPHGLIRLRGRTFLDPAGAGLEEAMRGREPSDNVCSYHILDGEWKISYICPLSCKDRGRAVH